MARQAEYQAHRDAMAEQNIQAKAAREAAARALEPVNFSSGIAQHGVYAALIDGMMKMEQQSNVKDTE